MKKLASLVLVPAILCALAGLGHAEESAPAPAPEKRWYGGQILIADSLSLAGLLIGAQTQIPLGYLGVGTYLFAPAVIHGAHHHGARSASSILMRVGLPIMGGLITSAMSSCDSKSDMFCELDAALPGIGLGVLTAVIVDASIAWDPQPSAQPLPSPAKPPKRSLVSLTSAGVSPTANGAQVVIGGRF